MRKIRRCKAIDSAQQAGLLHKENAITITSQCQAARILTDVDQEVLSVKAGLPRETISSFEKVLVTPKALSVAKLELAVEELGIEFLPEAGGSGIGVRLKFDKSQDRALAIWEDEGGEPADD